MAIRDGYVIIYWDSHRRRWEPLLDGPQDVFPSRTAARAWVRHLRRWDQVAGEANRYDIVAVADWPEAHQVLAGHLDEEVWPAA